tara:strand:+ start:356 stop:529 length:174 start_codon:yes stop_codon:yes gene_type:complete
MFYLLALALFKTFNAGSIVNEGPSPQFWIVLMFNTLLSFYGIVKKFFSLPDTFSNSS